MDRNGFAQFASIKNLAHRARVGIEDAEAAVECLSSVDLDSSNKDNDGRRIERLPGGFKILNAQSYRNLKDLVSKEALDRERAQAYRDRKRNRHENVTKRDAGVTQSDTSVSVSVSESVKSITKKEKRTRAREGNGDFEKFWSEYPRKTGKGAAEKSFYSINPSADLLTTILSAISVQKSSKQWQKDDGQYIPLPATWLNQKRWEDELQHKETEEEKADRIIAKMQKEQNERSQ